MGTGNSGCGVNLYQDPLVGLAFLGTLGCKRDDPTGSEKPVSVTLQFDVYNRTKGYRDQFTKTGMSGRIPGSSVSPADVGGDVPGEAATSISSGGVRGLGHGRDGTSGRGGFSPHEADFEEIRARMSERTGI
jgi:hypothetical protein